MDRQMDPQSFFIFSPLQKAEYPISFPNALMAVDLMIRLG